MTAPTFLQIHTLTSYPASLLNRDDVGFAKRIPFGSVPRLRVSSQCLKRHWRTHQGLHALSAIDLGQGPIGMSVRSRITFQRQVRDPLITSGVDPELATAVTEQIMVLLLGESAKAKQKKAAEAEAEADADAKDDSCKTSQLTVLGRPEVDFLLAEAKALAAAVSAAKAKKADLTKQVAEAAKKHFDADRKKNLRALQLGAGLDAALFGRMVTSDILARTDAAIHVAHAFTVHEEQTEADFFSAVDDLERERDDSSLGSGHIGSAELTTGLYYGYIAVDLPLLISNLTGVERRDWLAHRGPLAAEVIRRLIHLVTTVSPGAKLGSTAPHAYAHFVMAELGEEQPRTLANAFLNPVRPRNGEDLLASTYAALKSHIDGLNEMYGKATERRFAGLDADSLSTTAGERLSVADLAKWAAAAGG
ncbi:MAG: type I-E CRISPR-associated protein Cas7/Cse4/CasC [Nannocystis sp.]|nr:type I-E CRISPR-associated protein Cas7/Cse4/CasC [Nannocystis sp.]